MHIAESLLVASVEAIISPDEAKSVLRLADDLIASAPAGTFEAGAGGRSIHCIESVGVQETVAVYEPRGRIEIDSLPRSMTAIVDNAVWRSRAEIKRLLPSFREIDDWVYVEYGVGQYVSPHVDYARNLEKPAHPKIVGISIQLNDEFSGGEFCVETCGSSALWREEGAEIHIADAANNYSAWFRSLPRTRWTTPPVKGNAILYGSRVIHSTNPVNYGRARRLISWLLA